MWSTQRDDRLKTLWGSDAKIEDIAVELGCAPATISYRVRRLALPPRHDSSDAIDRDYVRQEADRRGISVPTLRMRIMRAVIKSKLINAVLDDDDEQSDRAPQN